MIKNYFKIAFRNLWRHKGFSLLNILGLTIGMTAFFLIFLYVKFEMSYDTFHSKADQIYRVVTDLKTPTETVHNSGPAWAVAPNIMGEFPEIEAAVRFGPSEELIRKDNIKFIEPRTALVDSLFFKLFDFKLIKGNPATVLNQPFNVVLSQAAAKKYFGDKDPVGQNIFITADALNATVTGVMEDMPENSLVRSDVLVSMSTVSRKLSVGIDQQWGNYGPKTFFLLKPGTDVAALQAKLPAFLERRNGEDMKAHQMYPTLLLEPLKDVYLHSTRDDSNTPRIKSIYIFSIVGVFILLIACINFVNLTTARSSERAKEVGIRKVIGAEKRQLALQFIGESVILCLIAFIVAVSMAGFLLPFFNQLSGKVISSGIFHEPVYVFYLLLLAIAIGVIAGIYPALVLSSFKPVKVLKGKFSSAGAGIILRKTLVITQFAIAIALIIATIVVYTQMNFMRSTDLGFSKNQKLIIDSQSDPGRMALVNELRSLPAVKSVSTAGSIPGGGNPAAYSQIENVKGDMQIANLDLYFVDFDYLPQYGIKMAAGRAFSKDYKTDTTEAMVINESAVKMFGYKSAAEAIGKKYDQWGSKGTIIGVMKDFHFQSLQAAIKPLSMRINLDRNNLITAEIATANLPATLATIEAKWKARISDKPFTYYFLDDMFNKQYQAEDKFGKLFLYFSCLAIFISCLGLLGLASYSTTQRTKEIGVRKVLGASVAGIVNLLSKDFLKLVILSFVIATPAAWYFMNNWLKDFAYRIQVSWWMFALAGLSAVLVALATISYQAIKAAVMNPVKNLRTE